MAKRDDEYHRLEGKKEGKLRIKREWNLSVFLAFSMASFLILYSFAPKGHDFSMAMLFGGPLSKTEEFSVGGFYVMASVLMFFLWGILIPDSYEQVVRAYEVKAKRKNSTMSDFDVLKLKGIYYFDQAIFWALYPISSLLFYAAKDIEERKKFFFRYGWLSHIEHTFFKQVVEKIDGYERAPKLKLLANYPELLSGVRGKKAKTTKEFMFTAWLFKSRRLMEDLFLIAEGYIAAPGEEMYDRIISREEFDERMKKFKGDREKALDSFRMYNGSDEVLWSTDVIFELIKQESEKFSNFINTYALNSRTLFSRRFQIYSGALLTDVNIPSYLFPNEEAYKRAISKPEVFSKHLNFALTCYFRFVLLKIILGQYINLPAGTAVIKIRDYTLRMITETFDDESLIGIAPGKNDGSTKGFNSDNLTNVFLACFNHYRVGVENSFERRVYNIFNLRDEKVTKAFEEEDIDAFSGALADGNKVVAKDAEPDSAWLQRLQADLANASR